ncbi:MAG: PQQ-dependent sugar dehydrogenase [Chitinophagaceae bacterium]|nr:MAG: PQQ-dependent sugar dehydrogenase [Chitinophagaceae bacterium]
MQCSAEKNDFEESDEDIFVIDTLLTGLQNPWGIEFLNEKEVLITERSGILSLYNMESEEKIILQNLPSNLTEVGQGGLLDIKKHPEYESNGWLYFTYAAQKSGGYVTELTRARLSGNQLTDSELLFSANNPLNAGQHFGSRITFDFDGYLYFTIGDRGRKHDAQDLSNHSGTVIRLNDDGSIPADNPFVGEENKKDEIWSYGHRNQQGMITHPVTGKIWTHEHGPRGGDEVNIIEKGVNYGWPLVTFGVNYNGTPVGDGDTTLPGIPRPVLHWTPSIAPCGMAFVHNSKFEQWNGSILSGALAGQHLNRIEINGENVINEERLMNGFARFRDIEQGPDGYIYIVTESPGLFIRLRPSS